MDRTDLERMLKQFNTEKAALESRLTAVTKASESLQALLEMTPAPAEWAVAATAKTVSEARHADAPSPSTTPKGKTAARMILQSDTSRFWTVREVWDEQVRRGWAQPRPRGTKGNPPARVALWRLQEDYPENVERIDEPQFAYKWRPGPVPSLNGSGRSHAGEGGSQEP